MKLHSINCHTKTPDSDMYIQEYLIEKPESANNHAKIYRKNAQDKKIDGILGKPDNENKSEVLNLLKQLLLMMYTANLF